MPTCYQLSPLLVLVTVSFHSFILADPQSAGSISAHIDGALKSQQSPHQQQQQQRQQHAGVPSSMIAPIASSYPHSFFQWDDSNGVSSDSLEGASAPSKRGLLLEPRGSPRFVGKKRVNEEVSSGILTDDHRVEKRSAPRFVGKRAPHYDVRGAPFFEAKRYIQNRASGSATSTPYLSAQEFKNTFRRTDPLFMGKRTLPDFDEDAFEYKRGAPRFVGKRGAPRFVGKRGPPRFVGKRGAPRFVGKRGAPRFVGKRDQNELDELFDTRGVLDDSVDEETPSGQHDDPSELIRSLFRSDRDLLASEFLASEMLNAERRGLVGLEDETADEGEDQANIKGQGQRAERSPGIVFDDALNTADSSPEDMRFAFSLTAKNQYAELGGPDDKQDSGEIFDKKPSVDEDGAQYQNHGKPIAGPYDQPLLVSKKFNEFVGKRSSWHPDLASDDASSGSDAENPAALELMRRLLGTDEQGKRQYEFVGKRPYDFLGKRYDFLGKRQPYDFIGKRYDFLGKRYDFLGKRAPYDFIGKRPFGQGEQSGTYYIASPELLQPGWEPSAQSLNPVNAHPKRYSEFLGKRKRTMEQGQAAMTDRERLAAILQDSGLRKRLSMMLLNRRISQSQIIPEFIGK